VSLVLFWGISQGCKVVLLVVALMTSSKIPATPMNLNIEFQSDKRNYSLLEAASNKGFLILSWHEQKVLRVQLKTSAVGCRTSNQLLLRL